MGSYNPWKGNNGLHPYIQKQTELIMKELMLLKRKRFMEARALF